MWKPAILPKSTMFKVVGGRTCKVFPKGGTESTQKLQINTNTASLSPRTFFQDCSIADFRKEKENNVCLQVKNPKFWIIKSFFDKLVFTWTNIIPQIFLQTGQPRSQGSLLPVGERTWERSCKQVIENIKFNHDKYPTPGRHSMTNTPTVGTQDKCLTNTREGYGYSWNSLSRSFQCFFTVLHFLGRSQERIKLFSLDAV